MQLLTTQLANIQSSHGIHTVLSSQSHSLSTKYLYWCSPSGRSTIV